MNENNEEIKKVEEEKNEEKTENVPKENKPKRNNLLIIILIILLVIESAFLVWTTIINKDDTKESNENIKEKVEEEKNEEKIEEEKNEEKVEETKKEENVVEISDEKIKKYYSIVSLSTSGISLHDANLGIEKTDETFTPKIYSLKEIPERLKDTYIAILISNNQAILKGNNCKDDYCLTYQIKKSDLNNLVEEFFGKDNYTLKDEYNFECGILPFTSMKYDSSIEEYVSKETFGCGGTEESPTEIKYSFKGYEEKQNKLMITEEFTEEITKERADKYAVPYSKCYKYVYDIIYTFERNNEKDSYRLTSMEIKNIEYTKEINS